MNSLFSLYARKDVQRVMVEFAREREVAVLFGENGFGKRPDMVQFDSDIVEFAKAGATSFHFSEERWSDPLRLSTGMSRKELDELRIGWDLVLDIDCPFVEFSKVVAGLLIEALQFCDVNHLGMKFSGNKGFHIIVPFESFPATVNNQAVRILFPDGPRVIAKYLSSLIREPLATQLLAISTIGEMAKATGKPEAALKVNHQFNPYAVVEIDTILISSRHLFRAPYSVNEKSGLVSVPLKMGELKHFEPPMAKISNIKEVVSFMDREKARPEEAYHLLVQAFDHEKKHALVMEQQVQGKEGRTFAEVKEKVGEQCFPQCMQKLLKGVETDGRKRSLFVLINFLKSMNYSMDEIEQKIMEWNKKNYEPLREGYVKAQLSWHKRQQASVLPPNCSHEAYYKALGVKCAEEICTRCKNPVNYALRLYRMQANEKTSREKKDARQKKIRKRSSEK